MNSNNHCVSALRGQPATFFHVAGQRFHRVFLLCILAAAVAPTLSFAQNVRVLQPSGKWVTDQADVLSTSDEERLSQKLSKYATETSTQIIVVTVGSLGGAEISDYAIELGRQWKVGQDEHDNGAVILVAKNERKVFIATGYGLEGSVPDALAGRIVRQIVTPNFKQGRFYEGISGAVDAIMDAASGEYQPNQILEETGSYSDSNDRQVRIIFFLMVLLWVVIIIGIFRARARHLKDGDDDDDDLDDVQRRRRRRRRRKRRSRRGRWPGVIVWGGGGGWSSGGSSGSSGGGGFSSGGGFSGGGGSFGGGGAGGSW